MADGKKDYVPQSLTNALNAIYGGMFGNLSSLHDVLKRLTDGNDTYVLCWDFQSYLDAQNRVDECYRNPKEWLRKSLTSIASSGKFSTDRTIAQYAKEIW
jgi:starch phosphorylase